MALLTPRCFERQCRHFAGVRSESPEVNERNVCTAFPDGIPNKIAYGKNLHLSEVKGDHGILYEKIDDIDDQ